MKSLRKAREDIAAVHMKDAAQARLSEHTRANCAFDAGYTWLLIALDEPRGGEHPSTDLLRSASLRLNVDPRTVAPALSFLSQRLKPFTQEHQLQSMLDWSKKMKALAGPTEIARTVDADTACSEELTTEGAAKLLNVSRTQLRRLVKTGQLAGVRRTTHGQLHIPKSEVLQYKSGSKDRQEKGLDAMIEASERLGLYDHEFASVRVRAKR